MSTHDHDNEDEAVLNTTPADPQERKTNYLGGNSWWKGGSLTLTESLRKMAAALSQHYNLKIDIRPWEDAIAHSDTKEKTITLGTKGIYTYGVDYYVGLLLHEIGHIRHTPDHDSKPIEPIKKFKNPYVGWHMYNMVEDRRIDERMKDEYTGASQFYSSLYGQVGEEVAASFMEQPAEHYRHIVEFIQAEIHMRGAKSPEEAKAIENECKQFLLYRTCGLALTTADGFIDAMMTTGVDECDAMSDQVARIVRDSQDPDLTDDEVVKRAMQVLVIIDPLIPDKEHSKKQAQMDAAARGDSGSGKGKGKGDGDEDDDEQGHGGMGAHKHSHDVKGNAEKMAFSKPPGRKSTPFANKIENQYTRADERMRGQGELLKRKLVSVMRDNDHQRFDGNKRRGLIQKKLISRVAIQRYRIYQQRIEKKGKKYAVAIVEDCSGSMWDGYGGRNSGNMPSDHAHAAVALLTRVFRALGFPSSITVFGTLAKTVLQPRDRYVVQQVNDRMETSDGLYYKAGGTELSNGIAEALKQLKAVGGGRQKLLICITDAHLAESDRRRCQMLLQKEMKHGDFSPMLYFIGNTGSHVLGDDRYEAHIRDVRTDLVPECVRLMKKVIAPMQW